jgi:hypothetical protein
MHANSYGTGMFCYASSVIHSTALHCFTRLCLLLAVGGACLCWYVAGMRKHQESKPTTTVSSAASMCPPQQAQGKLAALHIVAHSGQAVSKRPGLPALLHVLSESTRPPNEMCYAGCSKPLTYWDSCQQQHPQTCLCKDVNQKQTATLPATKTELPISLGALLTTVTSYTTPGHSAWTTEQGVTQT